MKIKDRLFVSIALAAGVYLPSQMVLADESISPEIQGLDLSGGCPVAQQKAAQYANNFYTATTSICESARANRKIGELTVRVAEICQQLPNWQQEKQIGEQMIQQSDQTISGSCL